MCHRGEAGRELLSWWQERGEPYVYGTDQEAESKAATRGDVSLVRPAPGDILLVWPHLLRIPQSSESCQLEF